MSYASESMFVVVDEEVSPWKKVMAFLALPEGTRRSPSNPTDGYLQDTEHVSQGKSHLLATPREFLVIGG